MVNFNCYIDEAGNEGIDTGGSSWFLLAGLLVAASQDLDVSRVVTFVKSEMGQRGPKRPIHWKEIRDHNKRLLLAREFGSLSVHAIICGMYKPWILRKDVFR